MYLCPQKFNIYIIGGVVLTAVLQIRSRMFLGLVDPDPDPLVRGMDPDPDPLVRGIDPAPVPDLDPCNIKQK
jgi:hypothetical protein